MNNFVPEKIKTINIKEDFPPADIAVADLEKEIICCKKEGTEILKVIHGYGSSGVGGEIKNRTQKFLNNAKKKKIIKDYIPGEAWGPANEKVVELQKKYPILILDRDLHYANSGITVIVL